MLQKHHENLNNKWIVKGNFHTVPDIKRKMRLLQREGEIIPNLRPGKTTNSVWGRVVRCTDSILRGCSAVDSGCDWTRRNNQTSLKLDGAYQIFDSLIGYRQQILFWTVGNDVKQKNCSSFVHIRINCQLYFKKRNNVHKEDISIWIVQKCCSALKAL